MGSSGRGQAATALVVSTVLVLVVVATYAQVARHEFINCDDDHYITDNPVVRRGLTWEGAGWAFAAPHAGNWHPLTWISHMADVELFGVDQGAGGHHLTSVVLHAASAVLLLWALWMMTGALWPSAIVAAMFALHPLRVESVAWASERKDVLGGLFWMLALLSYAWYARRPGFARYLLVFVCLALGLMSKPMLVTLPLVLLLLDFWPLGRWQSSRLSPEAVEQRATRFPPQQFGRLLVEKVPLLALSMAASIVAMHGQTEGGAMNTRGQIPLADRLANSLVSYVAYLWKTIWPTDLAIFYPHPSVVSRHDLSWLFWLAAAAACLLVLVTAAVIYLARRHPYLAVGWFWYLGTLVPVIGLVQVGTQARADRYTYLPLIGIYLAAVWGIWALAARWPQGRRLVAAAVVLLAAWTALTWAQVGHWRTSQTLFEHAILVTEQNYFAHSHLGTAYHSQNSQNLHSEAMEHFVEAVRIYPGYAHGRNNLGAALVYDGKLEEAAREFEEAVRRVPRYADAYTNLAVTYTRLARFDEAMAAHKEALRIGPDVAKYHYNLGLTYEAQARKDAAVDAFQHALQLDPGYFKAHRKLGLVYLDQPNLDAAVAHLERAVQAQPGDAASQHALGQAYARLGKLAKAEAVMRRGLELDPENADARANLEAVRQMIERRK